MKSASIGPREVADAAGVSTDTLRHYERLGLLPKTARTAAGYRRYPPAVIGRVQLIQRALVVGFSLKDLASVLRQRDKGEAPCRRVRALVGDRLDALDRRVDELTALRDEMRRLLVDWDVRLAATPAGQRARLLDMLEGRGAFERSRAGRAIAAPNPVAAQRSKPERLHARLQEAFNRHDLEAIVALYEPQAVVVSAGGLVQGPDAIRQLYRGVLERQPTMELKTLDVFCSGDLALLQGQWQWQATGTDGRRVHHEGRSLEVARLQPDERWLYIIDNPSAAVAP